MKITTQNGESFHSPSLQFAVKMLRFTGEEPVLVELDFFEKLVFPDKDAGDWIYSRMTPYEQERFVLHIHKELGSQMLSKLRSMLETM